MAPEQQKSMRQIRAEVLIQQDERKRDVWLDKMKSSKMGEQIYVGDGVLLGDVVRWLREALE